MDSDQIYSDANKSANNQCFLLYFSRLYFLFVEDFLDEYECFANVLYFCVIFL